MRASSSVGPHPGEIVGFRQNLYAELKDASGAAVTEVLVDPGWLAADRGGETAASVDAYLGCYTVDTADASGTMVGMHSVNASTVAVW